MSTESDLAAAVFRGDLNELAQGYTCKACGQFHTGIPFSFAADFPDPNANLSTEEHELRATIGSDQCILDSRLFFLRGMIEIPIVGSDEPFLWGVWASIREEVFDEIANCWELQGRVKKFGPYNGRLANSLSTYPETLNLKVKIVLQPRGRPPVVCSGRRPTYADSTNPYKHRVLGN